MRCPYCHEDNDKVADTRISTDGYVIRRRRTCFGCGKKFTTYERVEATQIQVIKRDRSKVPFNRERLREGLLRACVKRDINDDQIESLIAQVERDINNAADTEIQSQFIGERVMHYLGVLDQVAYVRFASVYRHFKDADDFVRELQRIKANPEVPDLSAEYVPKPQKTRFPKVKRSRYNEETEDES